MNASFAEMPNITENVAFAHVAREWRCKWSEADEKVILGSAAVFWGGINAIQL